MTNLLPCPFCGSSVDVETYTDCGDEYYKIRCLGKTCKISPRTGMSDSLFEIVDAWNKRAEEK